MKQKLIRVTTSDVSLDSLIKGQMRFMNQYYEVVGLSNDTGRLAAVGLREGVRVIDVPMHREISLRADIACLVRLYRIFRRERPFIVHSNTPKGSLLAMVAAKFARVPHRLYTVTGLRYQGATGLFRAILMTMERVSCFCATKVIPEGNGVKAALYADHITKKTLQVILNGNINGIDTTYFSPEAVKKEWGENVRAEFRRSLGLTENDFAFIFIGRIVGDKGMNELAMCMRYFQEKEPRIKLILVGSFETELDPLSNGNEHFLKTSPNVVFVGRQSDVRPYLIASDALCFPSYREGFPNVVLQAGAMGLASIVTDINGCNEIIIGYKNGMVIPPHNVEILREMMEWFMHHSSEITVFSQYARGMIISRYEQKEVWKALLEEYKKN